METNDNLPFISVIRHKDEEIVGIIQNSDDKFITIYDFNSIKTSEEKSKFIEYGSTWWWESHRKIPISIFLYGQMSDFRYTLKRYSTKETEIISGPSVCLADIIKKRTKRRQISLIKDDI